MNEAHCAVDRNRTTKDEEIAKLKQDHAKEIEKLTLDHKIKTMEFQNDFKLKEMEIENKQKQKTFDLEKENQSLKNEIEIMKMRSKHQQTEANHKLKEDNHNLRHKIEQMQMKSEHAQIEADNLLREENQLLKNRIESAKVECEKEKSVMRNQMEKENQKLKLQIDVLNLKKEPPVNGTPNANAGKGTQLKPLGKIPERFFEGAEKFLVSYNTGRENFFDGDYKLWYEDLSRFMENRKQYVNEKFVLIRKEVNEKFESFWFGTDREGVRDVQDGVIVEGLYEKLQSDTNVFLLHPDILKCLKMNFFTRDNGIKWWKEDNISKDFYFGDLRSVILLAELK